MKKFLLITTILMVFFGILVGCSNSLSNKNNSKSCVSVLRDLTTHVDDICDVPVNKDNIINAESIADYYLSNELGDVFSYSKGIVRGIVKNVTFTNFQGKAWTKYDVLISENYKGALKKGDLISIFMLGGYISLLDHIKVNDDAFRFKDISSAVVDKSVLKETVNGEPFLAIGDEFVFSLCVFPRLVHF